jgi:predicted SnoaL-like aldol condensation-catalyzing enzyme
MPRSILLAALILVLAAPGARAQEPVVAVIAEGDYVIVVTPRTLQDPKDSTRKYTTTWFDMWRFTNGKADEHWDGATK